jgi:hypothetical protein
MDEPLKRLAETPKTDAVGIVPGRFGVPPRDRAYSAGRSDALASPRQFGTPNYGGYATMFINVPGCVQRLFSADMVF